MAWACLVISKAKPPREKTSPKGSAAWHPVDRQRTVSAALQAYALMATSADKGAVRDVTLIQRRK